MIFGLCYVISKYHNIFVSTTKQIKKKRKLVKFEELWLHLGYFAQLPISQTPIKNFVSENKK